MFHQGKEWLEESLNKGKEVSTRRICFNKEKMFIYIYIYLFIIYIYLCKGSNNKGNNDSTRQRLLHQENN